MSLLRKSRFQALCLMLILMLIPSTPPARACLICLPVPTISPVDYLLGASLIVVAEEGPGAPYWLSRTKIISGNAEGLNRSFFVESPVQTEPSSGRNREVICAYGPQGEGLRPGWARVGDADALFCSMVGEILEKRNRWRTHPRERADYFSRYLAHTNQQIRSLAHLEVARAPYDQIRKFEDLLPFPELRSFLKNIRLTDWHPLYILLLARSRDAGDLALISGKVRSAAKTGLSLHLAAWLTGWMEMEPEAALHFLEQEYLSGTPREAAEIRAIYRALSVHGNEGHDYLRERIVLCYRHILQQQPEIAPGIVTDLMNWQEWGLADALRLITVNPPSSLDHASLLQISAYLRQAGDAATPDHEDARSRPILEALLASFFLLLVVPAGLNLYRWGTRRGKDS